MKFDIEIVVEDVEGAILAAQAGAHSIELCADLDHGGLTPEETIAKQAIASAKKHNPELKVHALILNRPDGFYADANDMKELIQGIESARRAGADGVVFGVLNTDNSVACEQIERLCKAAGPMATTFHRAFDRIEDQAKAIDELASLGVKRILTSGRPGKAPEHIDHLRTLIQKAGQKIQIVVGGGVRLETLADLALQTGAPVLHMSCRSAQENGKAFRPTDPNGLTHIMRLWKRLSV